MPLKYCLTHSLSLIYLNQVDRDFFLKNLSVLIYWNCVCIFIIWWKLDKDDLRKKQISRLLATKSLRFSTTLKFWVMDKFEEAEISEEMKEMAPLLKRLVIP